MIETLEKNRNQGRERAFNAIERERLVTDQITEASERLNGAMENTFEYSFHDDDFYFQGQPLRPIFEGGIHAAEEIVKLRPEFSTELLRRHIELQQLNEQIELIRNVDWQNPLVLVHISPTPDAVLSGEIDLDAYDTDRKKIMVRITEPTVDGVRVTSMSLDGNDRVALQAVGDFFGANIPDGASSEDILGMHFLAEESQFSGERPAKVLRERYDDAMQMQYGGRWYAGRRDSEVIDTMQKIKKYPELIEKHIDEIWQIRKQFGRNFRFTEEYKRATYNFLAAVEQANTLGAVVGSLSDAGDIARSEGVQFSDPDCPTSGVQTAEQALEIQGIEVMRHGSEIDTCMKCPLCKTTSVKIDYVGGKKYYTCVGAGGCGATTLPKSLQKQKADSKRTVDAPVDKTIEKNILEIPLLFGNTLERIKKIREMYGPDAVERRRRVIGNQLIYVADRRTDTVLAVLNT